MLCYNGVIRTGEQKRVRYGYRTKEETEETQDLVTSFFFFFFSWSGDANTFPYSKSIILRWFLLKDSRCPEIILGSCSCWNPSLPVFFPSVLKLLLHYPAGDNCQKLEMKESYLSFFSLHNSYSVPPI